MSDQMFAYLNTAIDFIQNIFIRHQFHGNTKLSENIIQDFPPN